MIMKTRKYVCSDLVKRRGAEGSRTLTGTDLNRVPLPIGLRPHCRSRGVPQTTCRPPAASQAERPMSRSTRATWPVALTFRQALSMVPPGPMTKVERITPITVRP